jgi:hypothetical protein
VRVLLLPILLVVAGCALSPEYRARYQAAQAAQQAELDQADDRECVKYGGQNYDACMMARRQQRAAADEAQRQAWLGLAQTGAQMMATPPPTPRPPPAEDHVCIAPNNTLYRC